MWFLQLEEFKGSFIKDEDIDQLVSKYEFFESSAENWPVHYRAAVVPDGDHILHLAFNFCDVQADHHLSFMLAIGRNFRHRYGVDAFNSLHVASDLGLGTVVGQLLAAKSVEVNAADDSGRTPLFCAASGGHEAVVCQLLAAPGININVVDVENETPLFWAANEGHEGVVSRLLTGRGIAVNAASVDGWTPLLCAANKGHEGVVRQLLAYPGIDVNAANGDGWTALFCAAFEGHEGIVGQLLAAPGIDVNVVDDEGETMLSIARDPSVIKILKSRANMIDER